MNYDVKNSNIILKDTACLDIKLCGVYGVKLYASRCGANINPAWANGAPWMNIPAGATSIFLSFGHW